MVQRYTLATLIFFVTIVGSACYTPLFAQDPNSPLGFQTRFPRIGFEGGLDFNAQDGRYQVGCGEFAEGSNTNIIFGLTWEKPFGTKLQEEFRMEVWGGFRQIHLSGDYTTTEPSVIQTADAFVEHPIDYLNTGEAKFAYLFLQPSAKFYPFSWIYVGAGFNVGLNISAKTRYTKDILTKVVPVSDGELIEAFYPADESSDPHSKIFPEEEPANVSALLFDPVGYVGFEFRFLREFYLSPRLTYSLPLNPLVTDPELKYSSLNATIGIRYDLR